MVRSADSPQAIWQTKLQELGPIKPHYLVNPANFWWHNPTNHSSLRLAKDAYLAIKASVKFYKFQVIHEIRPRTFLQLERWFKEPYYVQNRNTIHILSERDAMMLTLHANNLQQYLDNQESED